MSKLWWLICAISSFPYFAAKAKRQRRKDAKLRLFYFATKLRKGRKFSSFDFAPKLRKDEKT